MEVIQVERVDHHGLVASVIKDLKIIEKIDSMVGQHKDEKISTGEAIAGMIINGLGFTDCPMTLTPQFFENCPIELLFRADIEASDFNRFKLGRALDTIDDFGCELLFATIAKHVCKQENIDTRFGHLDTTSFSVTGEYLEDSDENLIKIKHGFSKDHRPDLKQVILELLVTQEHGVPLLSKVWDGNTSDNEIFQARAKALVNDFKNGDNPLYYVADCKLYSEKNSINLCDLPFITRIPESISLVNSKILEAQFQKDKFVLHDEKKKFQSFDVYHNNMNQRWIVVESTTTREKYIKSIERKIQKERELIDKELFHLQAQEFHCEDDAKKMLQEKSKKWKYHLLEFFEITSSPKYDKRGRPTKASTLSDNIKSIYKISANYVPNHDKIQLDIDKNSCFVIGTNIRKDDLSEKEIIDAYAKQQSVERGFRFLKDPLFFTSSFFLKKTSRIVAMVTIMTLALLVYSVAERRLRNQLKETNNTLPNQIKKEVKNPTLRWIFQLLDGISRVKIQTNNVVSYVWTGLTELRKKSYLCSE